MKEIVLSDYILYYCYFLGEKNRLHNIAFTYANDEQH